MVIQERDRHLLRELSVMRVVDREQAKVVAGFHSTTRANTRLLMLTQAGLLRRFFLGSSRGGMKALYSLSPKGAELVGVPCHAPRRKRDEVLTIDPFVNHQFFVNEIYCTARYRPIPVPDAKFVRWVSINKPVDAGTSLIPDGYFELSSPGQPFAAFLEVDLGTEALSVWKAKVGNYLRYAISGNFERRLGQPRFRVLVVTNSERRLKSIRSVVAGLTEKLFWFSTFEAIREQGFWTNVWLRPKADDLKTLL